MAGVVLRRSFSSFGDARGLDLASSVAYSSLLSFVPLAASVAVLTSTLFGETGTGFYRLLNFFVPAVTTEVVSGLEALVDRAQQLSGLAILLLLFASLDVFYKLEGATNAIWGATRPRPFLRRLALAFLVILVGPVAVGVITSLILESGAPLAEFRFSGLFISIGVFTVLYHVVPAAEVRWGPALAAGAVAGTGLALLRLGFSRGVIALASVGHIYGSVSAAVVFIIATGFGWTILLYGVALAHAVQFRDELLAHDEPPREARRPGALAEATHLLLVLAGAHRAGVPDVPADELPARAGRPEEEVRARLRRLVAAGLAVEEGLSVRLARDPDTISLYAVARAIGETHPRAVPTGVDPTSLTLRSLYLRADREERAVLQGTSLSDLWVPTATTLVAITPPPAGQRPKPRSRSDVSLTAYPDPSRPPAEPPEDAPPGPAGGPIDAGKGSG